MIINKMTWKGITTMEKEVNFILTCFAVLLSIMLVTMPLIGEALSTYRYEVDLTKVVKDRIKVNLDCSDFAAEQLIYHFPKIIPGTYMIANYGKYIKDFCAMDKNGNQLPVKKTGKNTYLISKASQLGKISYWVNDTWDAKPFWGKPYPMEGTNIEEGENFVINAAGIFGYFQGEEKQPVEVKFTKPENLFGITVLPCEKIENKQVIYTAIDYHQLIDCPVMFAPVDTVGFNVRNTNVLIGTSHETESGQIAKQIYNYIKPSMEAVGTFLDTLPAENYAYIYYFSDEEKLGEIISSRRFIVLKLIGYLIKNGLPVGGALEHNNSSFYYMIDPGDVYFDQILEILGGISIHEFMHIITPLNLHSQHIGNFNYADPVMSKHLWLYEGTTEYFSMLIQVRGGIISPKDFIFKKMRNKIHRAEKFPNEKMSFTEMSANVLEKKYKKQYMQVYERGAVISMLLDIEIIRLTDGAKTLIDVVLELAGKYGVSQSFDEDAFIDEFVGLVHPDLKEFFDKYIEGREELPYRDIFNVVGVEYQKEVEERHPKHPVKDNKVKTHRVVMGNQRTIKKVGKKDFVGFRQGDKVSRNLFHDLYIDKYGNYIAESEIVEIPVSRDNKEILIPVKVEYMKGEIKHRLRILTDMTEQQERYYKIWLGIDLTEED